MTVDQSEILDTLKREMIPKNPDQAWIFDNLLFLHVGGSRLYGTATDSSDWDVRGLTLAPKSYWVGAGRFEQREEKIPDLGMDVVIYDLRRWLHLAVAVNPNVVETLYVTESSGCVLHDTEAWRRIRTRVLPLINQRAHDGYHGYATSQIKKMMVKQSNKTGRREISDAHGWDVKFASHGFRLISQGAELLRTGSITFPRPDAVRLRDIRDGKAYGPDEADRCVAEWTAAAADLDYAFTETVLPTRADFAAYDRLLQDVYDEYVST